jgi:hypothetical protein
MKDTVSFFFSYMHRVKTGTDDRRYHSVGCSNLVPLSLEKLSNTCYVEIVKVSVMALQHSSSKLLISKKTKSRVFVGSASCLREIGAISGTYL